MLDREKTKKINLNSLQFLRYSSTPDEWELGRKVDITNSARVRDDFEHEAPSLYHITNERGKHLVDYYDDVQIIVCPPQNDEVEVIDDLTEFILME